MFSQRAGAAEAYDDQRASVYDEFNAHSDYEVWLGALPLLELASQGLNIGSAVGDFDAHVLGIGTPQRALDPQLAWGGHVFEGDMPEVNLRKATKHPVALMQSSSSDRWISRDAGPTWPWGQQRNYCPFEVKAAGTAAALVMSFKTSTPLSNLLFFAIGSE